MTRRRAIDIHPLLESMAAEVADIVMKQVASQLGQVHERLAHIEHAIHGHAISQTTSPSPTAVPGNRATCTVPGCGRPHRSRGLCSAHYQQLRYRERYKNQGEDTTVAEKPMLSPADMDAIHPVIRRKVQTPATNETLAADSAEQDPTTSPQSTSQDTASSGTPTRWAKEINEMGSSEQTRSIHPGLRPIV